MTVSKAPWIRGGRAVYDADGHPVAMYWGKTPEEAEDNA